MSTIRCVTGTIFLFFFLYTVDFSFVPAGIKTRMIVGGLGCCYMLYRGITRWRFTTPVLCLCLSMALWALFVTIYNTTQDLYWPRQMVLTLIYLMGAIFIIELLQFENVQELLYFIIICILINNLLAFSGMLSPSFSKFIYDLQDFELSPLYMNRAFGLGNVFFSGGYISGLGLIIVCYLYTTKYLSFRNFVLIYLVILISGLFIARTTIVGIIGLIQLLMSKGGKYAMPLISLILGVLILFPLIEMCMSSILGSSYTSWAFELTDNFLKSGTFETSSTNTLNSMYKIVPEDVKTWIIGDGLMNNPDMSYYKHTDVGYYRLVFSIGLPGLALFLALYIMNLRQIYRYSKKKSIDRSFCCILFIYILAVLLKGIIEILPVLFLIGYNNFYNSKKEYAKHLYYEVLTQK